MEYEQCRACLCTSPVFEWTINIKGKLTYADVFFALTKIEKSSDIPEKYNFLCTQCAEVLNSFVEFIRKAHKTHEVLKSISQEIINEVEAAVHESLEIECKPYADEVEDYGKPAEDGDDIDNNYDDEVENISNFEVELLGDEAREEAEEKEEEEKQETEDTFEEVHSDDTLMEYDKYYKTYIDDALETMADLSDAEKQEDTSNDQLEEDEDFSYAEDTESQNSFKKEKKYSTPLRYPCTLCDLALDTKYNLTRHLKRAHRSKVMECEICGDVFSDKDHLEKHIEIHKQSKETYEMLNKLDENPESTTCEKCSKNLRTNKHLRLHIIRVHEEKPPLLCQSCPLTFKNKRFLKKHELTHTDRPRDFACELCGMKFHTAWGRQEHVATHDPNRKPRYPCDQCDKSFFHSGARSTHKRTHGNNFIHCTVCGKKYYRQVDLDRHLRSHTGEAPFSCEKCGQSFKDKYRLNEHKRRHDGGKLKCDKCDEEFTSRHVLMRHRVEHFGFRFSCKICRKGFQKMSHLRRHISGVHKITISQEIQKNISRTCSVEPYKQPPQFRKDNEDEIDLE